MFLILVIVNTSLDRLVNTSLDRLVNPILCRTVKYIVDTKNAIMEHRGSKTEYKLSVSFYLSNQMKLPFTPLDIKNADFYNPIKIYSLYGLDLYFSYPL